MVTKKSEQQLAKEKCKKIEDSIKYPKKLHPLDPRNNPVDEGLENYLSKHYKEKIDDGYLKCCQDYYKSLKKNKTKNKGGQNSKKAL